MAEGDEEIAAGSATIEKIREVLLGFGMSHSELSRRADLSRSTVYRLMKGEQVITVDHVWTIARALNVEPYELLPLDFSAMGSPLDAFTGGEDLVSTIRRMLADDEENAASKPEPTPNPQTPDLDARAEVDLMLAQQLRASADMLEKRAGGAASGLRPPALARTMMEVLLLWDDYKAGHTKPSTETERLAGPLQQRLAQLDGLDLARVQIVFRRGDRLRGPAALEHEDED